MQVQVVKRGRGRPRVGDCRIETVVPKEVMALLIQRETEGKGYRTAIARNVLCEWASKQIGRNICAYNSGNSLGH
jgi:hypothetical protein